MQKKTEYKLKMLASEVVLLDWTLLNLNVMLKWHFVI